MTDDSLPLEALEVNLPLHRSDRNSGFIQLRE